MRFHVYDNVTGETVRPGDTVRNFRNEPGTFETVTRAATPGKSAKVIVDGREYYAEVWHLTALRRSLAPEGDSMIKLANGANVLRVMLKRSAPGSVTGNAVRVIERIEGTVLALSGSDYIVWTVSQSANDASVYDAYNGDYHYRGESLASDHEAYVRALARFNERAVR